MRAHQRWWMRNQRRLILNEYPGQYFCMLLFLECQKQLPMEAILGWIKWLPFPELGIEAALHFALHFSVLSFGSIYEWERLLDEIEFRYLFLFPFDDSVAAISVLNRIDWFENIVGVFRAKRFHFERIQCVDVWSIQRRPSVATSPESCIGCSVTGVDQTLVNLIDAYDFIVLGGSGGVFVGGRIDFSAVDRAQREEDPLVGTLLAAPRPLRFQNRRLRDVGARPLHFPGEELYAIHQR